ncbi:MAG: outer membrane homotrimeric porin [Desulfovibrio sp.]|nr:outer membrane homotrimeric porin [Desulfovibrio sp.]
MKKIATLLLAAGLVFGTTTGASAIDFKVKGEWIMSFDYGQNGRITGGNGGTGWNNRGSAGASDEFEAVQRVRVRLDAVASESLSGTVHLEMGDTTWGSNRVGVNSSEGGALGSDGHPVELKNAYIDWTPPNTDLKIRMGIQGIKLPSFTTGSQVFNHDAAGITASYTFNDNVALTGFWARAYNDNFGENNILGHHVNANYLDNFDVAGLILPLTFDGLKVSPWVMGGIVGPNSGGDHFAGTSGAAAGDIRAGMVPVGGAYRKDGTPSDKYLQNYGSAFWAGVTGDATVWDPFRIAFDVNYGAITWGEDGRLNRSGWLASLLFEYKLDWAIPGIYGWYSTGDDSDPSNGSERMPTFSTIHTNNGFSSFAFNGQPWIPEGGRDNVIGRTMIGTWGVGAHLKDMSFIDDLKHTFRVNYIGGTNSPTFARRYLAGNNPDNGRSAILNNISGPNAYGLGMDPLYLTTMDSALEIGLANEYQVYENFKIYFEGSYLATFIDKNVWKNSKMNGKSDQVRDPWNINLTFIYSF